jgi:hypothetical protein
MSHGQNKMNKTGGKLLFQSSHPHSSDNQFNRFCHHNICSLETIQRHQICQNAEFLPKKAKGDNHLQNYTSTYPNHKKCFQMLNGDTKSHGNDLFFSYFYGLKLIYFCAKLVCRQALLRMLILIFYHFPHFPLVLDISKSK